MSLQDAGVSRARLAAGALPLFFLSFLISANANALPQVFFQRGYPGQKALLLAVALLLSTAAAMLGIHVSARVRLARRGVAVLLLAGMAVHAALLWAGGALAFVALLALAQFLNDLLLNQLDHAAVARAGARARFSDTAGSVARLLGMLLAPIFFTASAGRAALQCGVIAVLGAAALAGALALLRLPARQAGPADADAGASRGRPTAADRLLFGHAIAVYAGLYLLAANLIFLLGDVLHSARAEREGGALVTLVFACAVVANLAAGALRPRLGAAAGVVWLGLPALAMAGAAGALLGGYRPAPAVCWAASACIGAAYGLFLHELRSHVSAAAQAGRPALIGWFNNVANVSALLAFGLMVGVSRGVAADGYLAGVMGLVIAVTLGGAALAGVGWLMVRARIGAPGTAVPGVRG